MALHCIREVASVKHFFQGRVAVGSRGNEASLQKGFADSLISMMNATKAFGAAEGSQLMESLAESPYGDIETARIVSVIDAKMAHVSSRVSQSATAAKSGSKQLLQNWASYLSVSDWQIIQDPDKSWTSKQTLIVDRGMRLGCTDGDEQTLKWALATLMSAHYKDLPPARQIYDKLQDLKAAWKSEHRPFMYEQLPEFPPQPTGLPAHIYNACYSSDDPPCNIAIRGIAAVGACIPLRSNSKLLKSKTSKEASQALAQARDEIQNAAPAPPVIKKQEVKMTPVKIEIPQPQGLSFDGCIDVDEQALLADYHAKVAALRAEKASAASSTAAYAPSTPLNVHRHCDGVVHLTGPKPVHVKLERDATPALPATVAITGDVAIGALDHWTQAAVRSLKERDDRKKADQAGTRDTTTLKKRPACATADAGVPKVAKCEDKYTAQPPMKAAKRDVKRDALKAEPGKAVKAEKCMKAKVKLEPREAVTKSDVMKAMPKAAPKNGEKIAPVHYKTGVIYTSFAKRSFRALTERGNNYSEKSRNWGGPKPSHEAWKDVVHAIDNAKKK